MTHDLYVPGETHKNSAARQVPKTVKLALLDEDTGDVLSIIGEVRVDICASTAQ